MSTSQASLHAPHVRPRIFIGSSTESLALAEAIAEKLDPYADCIVWNQLDWTQGLTTLEVLITSVQKFQFGIFVYAPDDFAKIRGAKYLVARDNVVLEHGLFVGKLGRDRVFFIRPDYSNLPVRLPTDLAGVIHGTYSASVATNSPKRAVRKFCSDVARNITSSANSLMRFKLRGKPLQTLTVSGASRGTFTMKRSSEVDYLETDFDLTYDAGRQWAELSYKMTMLGRGVDFTGDCIAKGEVTDGWAYMTYSATDPRNSRNLKGICMVRIPANWGGVPYGYWISADVLSELSDSAAIGYGCATKLRMRRKRRRS